MSDGGSAAAIDRLPWLDDEPVRQARTNGRLLWALVPLLLGVAGLSYWLGMTSALPEEDRGVAPATSPVATATVPLRAVKPTPVPVPPVPAPVVAAPVPVAEKAVPASKPLRKGRISSRAQAAPSRSATSRTTRPSLEAATSRYWPALSSKGAAGRMVRIGAFDSRAQAKKGWRRLMSIYPGMIGIPAAVVGAPSLRDGKTYYRLQIGTTSTFNSQVLCQRMRMIGQSCVVVGLDEAKP